MCNKCSMLSLVNKERRRHGMSNLSFESSLNTAAQAHSDDMRRRVFFNHTGSDNSKFSTRIRRTGYNFRCGAENISTHRTITSSHNGLMNSEGHRRNILNPNYRHIGIGIETYTRGRYKGNFAITQVFTD